MDIKKVESDDEYWTSGITGYDFEADWPSLSSDSVLSSVVKNDTLNQLDLLSGDGLTEVAENRSSDFLPFCLSLAGKGENASKLAGNFNPLAIKQKKEVGSIKHGPEETVKNMIFGLEYSLAGYKGRKEKIALLNAAVKSHDGNAILEVVLYLRDTLKKSIFQKEIAHCPDAVNVYLSYLEEDHETDELANMLLLLNKAEDAAILKYEAAVTVEHPERKLKWIENCLSTHFQLDAIDPFLQQSVEEHKRILEEQIKLEMHNQPPAANNAENNNILSYYENLTGKKCIMDSSVICTFIFSCLCNYNSKEFVFPSPEKLKSNYNLSKKQFTWSALRALAVSQRWLNIDDLFTSKNWLGGTKVRSCIAYSRVLEVLHRAKSPIEVMKKYVSCVENEKEKLELAQKYACHSIVIEIFKNNKDRAELVKYKTTVLQPHTSDFYTAADILNNSMIRWKN